MSKNTILLAGILIISIVIGVGAGFGVYYFLSQGEKGNNGVYSSDGTEQILGENNKTTPVEFLRATINFYQGGKNPKAVLTTDDNKQYVIWPSYAKSFYDKLGIKDGQKVEVQGNVLYQNRFYLTKINKI